MCETTPQQPSSQDTQLFDLVFQRIQKSPESSISFSEYMDLVLYAPGLGYYASPEVRRVGRGGDFYTSVSVGDTFGFLLGQRLIQEWETGFNSDRRFVVVEQGAHDGQLACDILQGLKGYGSILAQSIEYRIVDPREETRAWLENRFEAEGLGDRVKVVETLEEAQAERGIFLCNELLDAFPVHRLRFEAGQWWEWQVGAEEGALHWVSKRVSTELKPYVEELGDDYPEGYITEICVAAEDWMREVAALFKSGLWWIIDYGYQAEDYFAPHRKTGTLRCFREHQATEDPFEAPGEIDITAHVNFSHLRRAAELAGLSERRFTDQHHFLIEASRPWLLSIEGEVPGPEQARRMRQFQTLTHPSMMGQQFKVAEYSRDI